MRSAVPRCVLRSPLRGNLLNEGTIRKNIVSSERTMYEGTRISGSSAIPAMDRMMSRLDIRINTSVAIIIEAIIVR